MRRKKTAVMESPAQSEVGQIIHATANNFSLPDDAAPEEESPRSRAAEIAKGVTEAMGDPNAVGFAASIEKRKFEKSPNPFGFEMAKAGSNRVELLKSQTDEQRRNGEGAWVVRFAHNPNEDTGPNGETYSKENPHPVLKMLKESGHRWGFDADDKGGWGKPFSGDPFGADHLEAKKVLQKAIGLLGQQPEIGSSR